MKGKERITSKLKIWSRARARSVWFFPIHTRKRDSHMKYNLQT